jgi:WD40 repeat protein
MNLSRNFLFLILLPVFFSGSCQKTAILVNPEHNPPKTHSDYVLKVKYSPDAQWIASGGKDSDLLIWHGKTGKLIKQIKGNYDSIFDIEFLPEGNEVLTANYSGSILKWNINKDKFQNINQDKNFISSLAVVPDKKAYITSSWESSVKIFSTEDNKLIRECKDGNSKVRSMKYSQLTDSIYSGSTTGYLTRWPFENCDQGKNFGRRSSKDAITSLDINEKLEILVTGSADKKVKIYNLKTLKKIKELKGHKGHVNSVKILPKINKIASADSDGKIFLWDIKSGQYTSLTAHVEAINSIDASSDNKFLVSGSNDNQVKLWKLSKILSKKLKK